LLQAGDGSSFALYVRPDSIRRDGEAGFKAPAAPRRRKHAGGGWTIERQVRFLNILAFTRSVTRAARAVGMSRESAHRLRKRDPHGLFAAKWDACFALPLTPRLQLQVDESHRRAMALAYSPVAFRGPASSAAPSTS